MTQQSTEHNSIRFHVSGESVYIHDMKLSEDALIGHLVYSTSAHAKIKNLNCFKAKALEGVICIITHKDIPGINQMGPIAHDEQCLVENEVNFIGAPIALIAAIDKETAYKATQLIEIEYDELPAIIGLENALENSETFQKVRKIENGDWQGAIQNAPHQLIGELHTGGQEHWYLETQTALAVPQEGKEMLIYSSSQHPDETQAVVAKILGVSRNEVEVEVKRMGGAFGGKETQANHIAAWAALLAQHAQKPVEMHLSRDIDQLTTGKRHEFYSTYEVGFDEEGHILGLDIMLNSNGGSALDLSMAILERALFHIDNAYFLPTVHVQGLVWKSNIPSNTAFRGFGGPQGIAVIETIIDRISRFLKKDSSEIRLLNFYGENERNTTHYGQNIGVNRLPIIYKKLTDSSDYFKRRESINQFNSKNEYIKRGLAMTPVKFGISFTTSFLNQAGALVNIYQDGSVNVNHGGTEMGQGLHTKIRQIAADVLGIDANKVNITATNTSKVPNASATAASSGTDLNGMAVKNACDKLIVRLSNAFIKMFPDCQESIYFKDNIVQDGKYEVSFAELVRFAYINQYSLSSTGFYKTPDIHFDREKGRGTPFNYFAFGMAISEVEVDILTGRHQLLRTDILHDVGTSVNHLIDKGQVEGAFVQCLGWVTSEEMKYDKNGKLLNHSPDTYKIPAITDIPRDFRVDLLDDAPNPKAIKKSKAVGEPPFILGLSVWLALKDAVSAVGNHQFEPEFQIPATHEYIALSCEKMKKQMINSKLS
ncbi:MAG: xanthine dehydrogenase molybdopterin binding subunit [Bacteroidales bacterium]|jgi:xanthine dehydrogenase large subunit|nr:xanthine dehydrogenase molybdopterin binding subunit [Bacteroidales bacterium]